MIRLLNIVFLFMLAISISCSVKKPETANYYFDPVNGNDSINSGTSPKQPYKSLSMISKIAVKPGDSLLLKSGAVFTEQLYISCKGDSGNRIVVGKYGGAERPYIKAGGMYNDGIYVFNSEFIVIRDLEVSNKGPEPVGKINGILVELRNYGTARDIILDNLFVHDVFGSILPDSTGGGNGIMIRNCVDDPEDSIKSRFHGLIVQNCIVRDCVKDGIMMWGNWIRSKWYPNLDVVIRNNLIEGVPGHGIVPVGCESPLVEYNIMRNCPDILSNEAGTDGIWPWGCDNALVQYNVVSDQIARGDGFGFDSDYNCTNSIFQYNLSFNNAGGFLLICNPGGWPADWCLGNTGTIIRYNVSINDGIRKVPANVHGQTYFSPVINITGPTKNTLIEKNIFILAKKENSAADKTLVHLTDWRGYPDSTTFRNNIIFSEEANYAWKASKSTNNFVENNFYQGDLKTTIPGFIENENMHDIKSWYEKDDENREKLFEFLKDKSLIMNGKEVKVMELLEMQLP